jgi:hypothetical protein
MANRLFVLVLPAVLGLAWPALAAEAPSLRDLRTQKIGGVTYFHVRFETPKGYLPEAPGPDRWNARSWSVAEAILEPRLVPQDGKTQAVCWRGNERPGMMAPPGVPGQIGPRQPVPVEGLEFVGKIKETGEARFLLLYPTESRVPRLLPPRRGSGRPAHWAEVPVTIDFSKAKEVAIPKEATERQNLKPDARKRPENPRSDAKEHLAEGQPPSPPPTPAPVRDDLEGLWAAARVDEYGRLQAEVDEFGFYAFAAQATARKYGVPLRTEPTNWRGMPGRGRPDGEFLNRELYETTTGASAITESLALRRLLGQNVVDRGERTIPITDVRGIDIAEHPWEKMMEGKKPAPEPLARLVPFDNYYVTFKSIRKFIEFGELLDAWGTNLIRAYELHSRDYRLKERYEKQLCIRSTSLGKTLGPLVVKGIALTGSDAYLREGSDVTVIFHVVNKGLFFAALEPFIEEARKEFGPRLRQTRADYQGVPVESYVTPQREVSLHRAAIDDFVIYSNSPVGVRRVLDAYQERGKRLADSLDFQYMRTIFRFDDKAEDGFAYLSDAFIRQLVGPADKIKEKRRLEALTSLSMLTHAALYSAWETGKLPADQKALLATAGLKEDEIRTPDGPPPVWDAERTLAYSDAYGTIPFATPLIEQTLDKVTQAEADDYNRFRLEYLGLWRQYFDPIGLRIGFTDEKVKIDTYVLPLIRNSTYNELRRVAGDGTVTIDPSQFSPKTLVQFVMHLSPAIDNRSNLFGGLFGFGRGGPGNRGLVELIGWGLDPVGKWFLIRFDDSEVYARLFELLDRSDRGELVNVGQITRLVFQVPVVIGMDIKNPVTFAGGLAALRKEINKAAPDMLDWEPLEEKYKDVTIVRVQARAGLMAMLGGDGQDQFRPALYYCTVDNAFYLTLNEATLRDAIDRAKAPRESKTEKVEVNSSLYLAPGAADKARAFVRGFLERQTQHQALNNDPIWYALYHPGLLSADADAVKAQETAFHYFGFVPVSPDGAAYAFDRKTDEVVNERHGSLRKPRRHADLAENAPLGRLLEQLRTLRADLRFREDGVHTVLTIDRK